MIHVKFLIAIVCGVLFGLAQESLTLAADPLAKLKEELRARRAAEPDDNKRLEQSKAAYQATKAKQKAGANAVVKTTHQPAVDAKAGNPSGPPPGASIEPGVASSKLKQQSLAEARAERDRLEINARSSDPAKVREAREKLPDARAAVKVAGSNTAAAPAVAKAPAASAVVKAAVAVPAGAAATKGPVAKGSEPWRAQYDQEQAEADRVAKRVRQENDLKSSDPATVRAARAAIAKPNAPVAVPAQLPDDEAE